MRIWRAAFFRDMPERTRSSVYCSMWKRSSSDIPCSNSRRRVRTRNRERRRLNMSHLLRRGIQGCGDRRRETVPAGRFVAQAAAPRGGQPVILCAAVVLALPPFGGDEIVVFQSVEGPI